MFIFHRRAGRFTLPIIRKRYILDLISIIKAIRKDKMSYDYITFHDL